MGLYQNWELSIKIGILLFSKQAIKANYQPSSLTDWTLWHRCWPSIYASLLLFYAICKMQISLYIRTAIGQLSEWRFWDKRYHIPFGFEFHERPFSVKTHCMATDTVSESIFWDDPTQLYKFADNTHHYFFFINSARIYKDNSTYCPWLNWVIFLPLSLSMTGMVCQSRTMQVHAQLFIKELISFSPVFFFGEKDSKLCAKLL